MVSASEIHVNGNSRRLADGQTVASLLADLDLIPETVAVELNREIIRRTEYAEVHLKAGDRLEIVRFVQGG